MNILYLSHRIPFPPNKGDKIRSYHQVKYLAARHQLDLVCLADDPGDVKYADDLRKLCRKVHVEQIRALQSKAKGLFSLLLGSSISVGYFHRRSVQKRVDQWLSEIDYDVIVCFSSTMAEYVFRSRIHNKRPRPRLVMDFCDVDSDKWRQYAERAPFPQNLIYRSEWRRLQEYERKVRDLFDVVLLISHQEAEVFESSNGMTEKVKVIANGIDWNFFDPDSSDRAISSSRSASPVLVFTGAMDYRANIDGVTWFCHEVLPQIRKSYPSIQFKIVGSNPTPEVCRLASCKGVEVTGFVEDIRPYYVMADICVVPLRMARGVQNKLLEAMAMQRAVVATSAANAGVKAQGGEHLLLADSSNGFALAVTELLKSPDARSKLARSARNYVLNNFDWEKNLRLFDVLLNPFDADQAISQKLKFHPKFPDANRVGPSCGSKQKSVEVL